MKYRFNGEGFIYDRRPHVFVVAREGGAPKQITEGDYAHGEPAWSPDGRLIAFTAARHEARDDDDAVDLWVVEADGGQPRRLTSTSGPVSGPSFAPDGRMVAYVVRPALNAFGRNHQLFAVSPEGGTARSLSAGLDRSIVALGDTWASWSPDGQSILFAVEDGGRVRRSSGGSGGERASGPRAGRRAGGERALHGARRRAGVCGVDGHRAGRGLRLRPGRQRRAASSPT